MNTALANYTGALVGELQAAFTAGDVTLRLDAVIRDYAGYWRKMGASSDAVIDFVQRLISRARATDEAGLSAEQRSERELLAQRILERVGQAYFAATK